MKHRVIGIAAGALLVFGTGAMVFAQGPGGPRRGPGFGEPPGLGGPGGGFLFEGMVGRFGGKPVLNEPFTAQVMTEHTETLQDGSKIDDKSTGTIARDADGRTYRQMALPGIGPIPTHGKAPDLAFISDPVAGVNYVLNLTNKTYEQIPIMHPKFAKGGTNPPPPHPNGSNRPHPDETTLPSKVLDGLTVTGTQITHTIPAGAIGNASPIVSTIVRWYSDVLHLLVMETRTDPRFGTNTYELTSVTDSADPTLFMVPSGFTLKQGRKGGPRGAWRGKGPAPTAPPAAN